MTIFSYHLVRLPLIFAYKNLIFNPMSKNVNGLIHFEYMTSMTLGSPIISPSRFQIRQVAIFAQWENELDLVEFLKNDKFGKKLKNGWHLRLELKRVWGEYSGFKTSLNLEKLKIEKEPIMPVVAITIAKMKPLEIPRFIEWGRPVEKLVRDHPDSLLSLASFKIPNIISTFSIWKSEKEMTEMVYGNSKIHEPKRHHNAMMERERKDFHFEFTTLRFKVISEIGKWNGKSYFS